MTRSSEGSGRNLHNRGKRECSIHRTQLRVRCTLSTTRYDTYRNRSIQHLSFPRKLRSEYCRILLSS